MNVLIIYSGEFPVGQAQTNRIKSYSKGFVENGVDVKVIISRPIINRNKLKFTEYAVQGIKYFYSYVMPDPLVTRKISLTLVASLINTIYLYFFILKDNQIDVLIMQDDSLSIRLLFYFITKIKTVLYLRDESEYPFLGLKDNKHHKFSYYLKTVFTYKLFDGLFVMTKNIQNYLKPRIRKDAKLKHIPMTVDVTRFEIDERIVFDFPFIAYCGDMSGNKDGVPILIRAFHKISFVFQEIELHLIGSAKEKDMQYLKELVHSLGLDVKVRFIGTLPSNQIPKYLKSAKILALARPNNVQAHGGFPTKLGEYLATGNPVVVTRVGEIPLYLKDKFNAILCKPDSPELFAEGIIYLLNNPERAYEIGMKGKELTYSIFNYRVQASNMIKFIEELQYDYSISRKL